MNPTTAFRCMGLFAITLVAFFLLPTAGYADDSYSNTGVIYTDGNLHTISSATLTGGASQSINTLNALTGFELDDGSVNMTGGNVIGGTSANNSAVNRLNGAVISGNVNIHGGSITGGSSMNTTGAGYYTGIMDFGGILNIYGGSISAGTAVNPGFGTYMQGLSVSGGTVNIYGGSFTSGTITGAAGADYLDAINVIGGTLNLYGANFTPGSVSGQDSSFIDDINVSRGTVYIYGKGFNLPYGPVAESGVLTGTLEGGETADLILSEANPGEIILAPIPEPDTNSIASLAGLVFAARRYCRKTSIRRFDWINRICRMGKF